jgi:uncharacterized protein
MVTSNREFQIFIKPAGARCNLSCSYCYYLGKDKLYPPEPGRLMDDETLERYISQHISASTDPEVFFSWHGGEPLLAGIDFYRKAVEIQEKLRPEGYKIMNGIQTNGTLLDKDWCRFFSEKDFYVGISIDGDEQLHNSFRIYRNGEPSFKKVISGYNLLKEFGIRSEILCVVSSVNVKYPQGVYRFFKTLGADYITFLPLVTRKGDNLQGVTEDTVEPDDFGRFLIDIFDEWLSEDIGKVKIQVIEEALRTAFDQEHTLCIFRRRCGGVPVIEHNGDFYSCDHYVDGDHLLGNINLIPLENLLDDERQIRFGITKEESLPDYCRNCEVLSMCNGECPKNRFLKTPSGEPGMNYLCQGYRMFFNHIRPFTSAVRDEWLRGKS